MDKAHFSRSESDELVQLRPFRWSPPTGGYRWIDGFPHQIGTPPLIKSPRKFLIPCSSEEPLTTGELDPALFREFAEINQTPNGILEFANKYGWLGVPEFVVAQSSHAPAQKPRETPGLLGEGEQAWITEIRAMFRLLPVWEHIARHSPGRPSRAEKFKQRIHWRSGAILYEWAGEEDKGCEVIASERERPALFKILQGSKNLRQILRFYLQSAVNEKIAAHKVAVRLLWDRNENLGLAMVPDNLVGFLWLQFARAIQGETAYRQCEDCGRWFAYVGQSGRSDKRFCSGTCKARSHRAKRQRT